MVIERERVALIALIGIVAALSWSGSSRTVMHGYAWSHTLMNLLMTLLAILAALAIIYLVQEISESS